jgi:N-acetyl-anhydromuramyl-L-alanine amidase AmpD
MAESTATIVNGKLVASRVIDKVTSKIDKGALTKVNAIIIHQTGSDSADSSLSSYSGGVNGAHFLIDKDGTIFSDGAH